MVHAGPPPLQTLSLNRGTSKRTPRLSPNERQSKPIRPGGKKEFFGEGRGDGVLWIHLSVFFRVVFGMQVQRPMDRRCTKCVREGEFGAGLLGGARAPLRF